MQPQFNYENRQVHLGSYSSSNFQSINVMSVGRKSNVSNPRNRLNFVIFCSCCVRVCSLFIRWRIQCSCLSLIPDTFTLCTTEHRSFNFPPTQSTFPSPVIPTLRSRPIISVYFSKPHTFSIMFVGLWYHQHWTMQCLSWEIDRNWHMNSLPHLTEVW